MLYTLEKNSQTITNEFSIILTSSKRLTLKLESERGKEWYNSITQNFQKKNIQHYSRFTDKGPSKADRVIRTIRNLLKKPVFEKLTLISYHLLLKSIINQFTIQ